MFTLLQGSNFFNWSVHTVLSHFVEFSNLPYSARLIKAPNVFSGPKSNYLFSINYNSHSDTKKKKKNLANYRQNLRNLKDANN